MYVCTRAVKLSYFPMVLFFFIAFYLCSQSFRCKSILINFQSRRTQFSSFSFDIHSLSFRFLWMKNRVRSFQNTRKHFGWAGKLSCWEISFTLEINRKKEIEIEQPKHNICILNSEIFHAIKNSSQRGQGRGGGGWITSFKCFMCLCECIVQKA